MAQAKYLDAAQDLRCLQGTAEFGTLANLKMGSEEFASLLKNNYRTDTLIKARQILDVEQDLQTLNENDPIGTTLEYGGMTRTWLSRQSPAQEAIKHPMVTENSTKETVLTPEEDHEAEKKLDNDIANFLGKNLPSDPNAQLLMWDELAVLQTKLKVVEMEMRKKMADHFFPKPTEGVNSVDIGKGWKIKLTHKLNRTADEASFESVFKELGDDFQKEDLFKFKPELKKAVYNKLTDKNKVIFDQCLIIKPGSPTLVLVAPKGEK